MRNSIETLNGNRDAVKWEGFNGNKAKNKNIKMKAN